MAIYNEILAPRFARGIQKLFGIKGAVPTKQLSGEIIPVLPLSFGVESRFTDDWRRYGITVNASAVALNFSEILLSNPTGSNVIVTMEKIDPIVSTNQIELSYGQPGTLALPTAQTPRSLDGRNSQGSTLVVTSGSVAGGRQIGTTIWTGFQATAAGVNYEVLKHINQEIPLSPGDALHIQSDVANVLLTCSFFWRERFLEEPERK